MWAQRAQGHIFPERQEQHVMSYLLSALLWAFGIEVPCLGAKQSLHKQ